jgi:hypothetical protein
MPYTWVYDPHSGGTKIPKAVQERTRNRILANVKTIKMNTSSYSSPVDKLLTLGGWRKLRERPNYLELGLGQEHVDDLIRMATDEALNTADSDSLEVWAPIHALYALGQLRAEAAIHPIIGLFDQTAASDNEAVIGLSEVMGMIGPAAIPALAAFIADPVHKMYPRSYAGDGLEKIGEQHPAAREECVRSIAVALEKFARNESGLNGFLIANLLGLKAVEAAPVMERAFAAGCVDEIIAGDWEDVQIKLGLLEARKTERRYSLWNRLLQHDKVDDDEESVADNDSLAESSQKDRKRRDAEKARKKNRRVMAKRSRRMNRKKKR